MPLELSWSIRPSFAIAFQVSSGRSGVGPNCFGIWTEELFIRGFQPYDQVDPAAYLPYRFDDVERIPLGGEGPGSYTLLIRKGWRPTLSKSQWDHLVRALEKFGLGPEEADVCLATLNMPNADISEVTC
jgi:hypothetical protein